MKIFPFGSYKIQVMSPTSDIDCLCVAPKWAKRTSDFFGGLYDILESHGHVSNLRKIETAKVPVMKLKFRGIEIDLTYANINKENIKDLKEENLLNDEYL